VTVLDAAGGVVREEAFGGELSAVELTGAGLLVQRRGTLELRGAEEPRTFVIGTGARLEDALGKRSVYSGRGLVTLLRLAGGERRTLVAGTRAALEDGRVAVASGRGVVVLSP
jgi:hypothetical protein